MFSLVRAILRRPMSVLRSAKPVSLNCFTQSFSVVFFPAVCNKICLVCNRQKVVFLVGGFVAHFHLLSSLDHILSASAHLQKFVTNDPFCCIFQVLFTPEVENEDCDVEFP